MVEGDVGLPPFRASWPDIRRSCLLVAFVARKLCVFYIAFSIISLIFKLVNIYNLAIGAVSIMFFLTLAEFDVCGIRSLVSSFLFLLAVASLIDIFAESSAILILIILTPFIWLTTSSLIHIIVGIAVLPAQFTYDLRDNNKHSSVPRMDVGELLELKADLVNIHRGRSAEIVTADGVTLDAMFFQFNGQIPNHTPAFILATR